MFDPRYKVNGTLDSSILVERTINFLLQARRRLSHFSMIPYLGLGDETGYQFGVSRRDAGFLYPANPNIKEKEEGRDKEGRRNS